MTQHFCTAWALSLSLTLSAAVPSLLHAQDRPDEQHDQPAPAQRHDERTPGREAPRADDQVAQYRHAHPSAAARCHDGFFTKTKDRGRACSKHGGIDVWLGL
jgi:hypothetical protein